MAESGAKRERAGEPAKLGSVTPGGGVSAGSAAPPSAKAGSGAEDRGVLKERVGTHATVPPSLVRVPDEIADCSWPCYAEAAYPPLEDPYTGESFGPALPVSDAELDDGYRATAPGPLGGPMPAVWLAYDDKGIIGAKVSAHHEGDDIRRAALKQIYRKRARDLQEWGTVAANSTDENAKEAVEPE